MSHRHRSDRPDAPTRRRALAGLGAAAAALIPGCRRRWSRPQDDPTSRSQVKPYVPGAQDYATYEERWFTSSCAQCPAACGIRVRVVEGRAVRIEGNRDNPLNRGGIGVRGLSGLQVLYDPDRVRGPLRRKGGVLEPVSWGEALDVLATALRELRRHAPERLLVMSGQERGFVHELLARLCEAFGTPNFVDGTPGHSAPLARAMELSLGVRDVPAFGWAHANAILSLEAGLLEDSCRSIYFARVAAELRREHVGRARLIHAGPTFDLAAFNADRWLRIAPGTSGALALGLCHVLLREGTYDTELVDRAGGVAGFRDLVARFSPERVATITGAPAAAIVALAHTAWERRPVLAVVDERSLAFSNGVDTARAAIALSALLGAIEDTSGGLRIPPSPPYAAWPAITADDVARRGLATTRLDGAGAEPHAGARAVLDTLPDALLASPPAIALLYHANPVYARAQPRRWRDALAGIPLVVSFSPVVDETVAAVAHLVLPDHTYLERFEDATPAPGLPRAVAGIRRPVVAPLHDTRPTGDVVLELARRIGDPVARALPWATARDAFEDRLLGLHAAARGTIVEASPRAFLDRLTEAGFWAEAVDAPARIVHVELPQRWEPPAWDGDPARFPLALLAYRPLGYAEGSGANQPWLRSLRSRPGLADWMLAASISPHDAPPGLATGDLVRVTSPSGSLVLPAHVEPRLAPGCVAIPTGGGHDALGRWARGFGVNVMELLPARPAPDTGASLLCSTRVRVTREEG
ncbi:MAG TPA: molybdopterin-dependent oxidoreductase [Kofleriaceae bacterium]|nr:molybdopterin-dependent oxidoreductase [Kofleriaceae bacterium]